MRIRFADHITASHREGILAEIADMVTAEQLDEDSYVITVVKEKWYLPVLQFLRDEEGIGNLELDEASNS